MPADMGTHRGLLLLAQADAHIRRHLVPRVHHTVVADDGSRADNAACSQGGALAHQCAVEDSAILQDGPGQVMQCNAVLKNM